MSLVGLSLLGLFWWRREGFWKVVLMETVMGHRSRVFSSASVALRESCEFLNQLRFFQNSPFLSLSSHLFEVCHIVTSRRFFSIFVGSSSEEEDLTADSVDAGLNIS